MHGPAPVLRNARQVMRGWKLLRSLEDGCAALAFLDPQYRAVLDRQRYGNEGKSREVRRAALPAMTDAEIALWIWQLERALRPSGHLMIWTDKFTIASGGHRRLLVHAERLDTVDMIAWNKARPGMGSRARCQTEYLLVLQKRPTRAAGAWTDKALPDTWTEMAIRSAHPHAKPYHLAERLIRAVTRPGELVVDPCAGSYVVLDACIAAGREFVGCDIKG